MNSKLRDVVFSLPLAHQFGCPALERSDGGLMDYTCTCGTDRKAEKAIRQAVAEEMLELLPKKSHTAQKAYRVESNDYVSVVEEKAANKKLDQVRQKIKEWGKL